MSLRQSTVLISSSITCWRVKKASLQGPYASIIALRCSCFGQITCDDALALPYAGRFLPHRFCCYFHYIFPRLASEYRVNHGTPILCTGPILAFPVPFGLLSRTNQRFVRGKHVHIAGALSVKQLTKRFSGMLAVGEPP